ncbi:uncharacterized protein LOC110187910 [Drosophila serrata]|uniref:uncharacterized protein LOC110187910 n=1 Tax=Drosophila serrata TaxID=7274 RepID=UPI000A1CFF3B|nr:uncharacterized protein LOC110187910 [Drosophila serrata]
MCDFVFNILILGDADVGKTFLFGRFLEDRFSLNYNATGGGGSKGRAPTSVEFSRFRNVSHWLKEHGVMCRKECCPPAKTVERCGIENNDNTVGIGIIVTRMHCIIPCRRNPL